MFQKRRNTNKVVDQQISYIKENSLNCSKILKMFYDNGDKKFDLKSIFEKSWK